MTTLDARREHANGPSSERARLGWAMPTSLTITWRNLVAILRTPELPLLLDAPADHVRAAVPLRLRRRHPRPGVPYVDYLMPGIFVQTVMFGAVSTAIGLSEDLHKGLIERFRALPMSRTAVLAGRTMADLVRNISS